MEILRGAAVVGQSGGPTAAINATLAGVIDGYFQEKKKSGAVTALYGMRNGIEGFLKENLVNLGELFAAEDGDIDEEKKQLLINTPAAGLGSCRNKLPKPAENPEFFENLIGIFKKYDIRYFFYIGGNDSMDTVAKLSYYAQMQGYDIMVIGVPKTIDNDVCGTDHTPGYGSAAKYIAATMQEIIRDCAVYTVPAVTVVEVMGRDAGWLTAAAALPRLAGGDAPDLVYLPERAFSLEFFLEDVKAELAKKPNVVVAVSEGIRFADGRYVCEEISAGGTDVFGHKALTGTGKALEMFVKEKIGCKVRSVELNISQRCGSHISSLTDIRESEGVGASGVVAALEGRSVVMMGIIRDEGETYSSHFEPLDVTKIANQVKHVPQEFINERGCNVTDECARYILPLIEGEIYPEYVNGLPVHFIFD